MSLSGLLQLQICRKNHPSREANATQPSHAAHVLEHMHSAGVARHALEGLNLARSSAACVDWISI
jgi:hypothetical protein